MRHAGVGCADYDELDEDPFRIAVAAVEGARDGIDRAPDFAFVFASPRVDLEQLVAAFDDALDCEWVGCSTANELCNAGHLDRSVVVLLVASDDVTLQSIAIENVHDNPHNRSADAARQVGDADAFIPIVPGFTQEQPSVGREVLKGILSVHGPETPVVGAAAGDDLRLQQTHQFRNGELYTDALVLTALQTDNDIVLGLDHGFEPTNSMYMPTVDGDRVTKLNGRPAQEVYAEDIGVAPEELEGTVEAPTGAQLPAVIANYSHQHPFGVAVGNDYVLKVPEAVEDGAIVFSSEIPENTNLVLMRRADTGLTDAATASVADWIDTDRTVTFGLVFECAGRLLALQEENHDEVDALCRLIDGPFAGFFSYEEIGGLADGMCTANFFTVTSLIVYEE